MNMTGLGLAAAAGLALSPQGVAPDADAGARLARKSEEGNAALMRGDAEGWAAAIPTSKDFVLMSPFGGRPTGGAYPPERLAALGRVFRNGDFSQEIVKIVASPDLVVLVTIERTHVEVGGLPAQDWALRVTQVHRRDPDGWRLVLRHADPLANGLDAETAAALGRGAPVR